MAREFDVCVVGGGPAGSVTSLRLAKLGHRVCLIECCAFPRHHVGESITKGIWPISKVLGIQESLLQQEFLKSRETRVRWSGPFTEHLCAIGNSTGLIVDRAKFDALLLHAAAASGVQVVQPARVVAARNSDSGWQLQVRSRSNSYVAHSSFLVDASGRSGFLRGNREHTSPRTLALCGYVSSDTCPGATLVEALSDSWCWGAPIPGAQFSMMVFLDPQRAPRGGGHRALEKLWRRELARADLFCDVSHLPLTGSVRACDATVYYTNEPIGLDFVRVGEAAFSLDPLSSTGVEKAMQTGLAAAVTLHTMMLRPERSDLCLKFYRDRHFEAVSQHAIWSAGFYQSVDRYHEFPFWQTRSRVQKQRSPEANPSPQSPVSPTYRRLSCDPRMKLQISETACIVQQPCIVGNEILSQAALKAGSDRAVAFVDGIEIAPLLALVPQNIDFTRLISLWSSRILPESARGIAEWLIRNRILEPVP